MQRLLGAVLAGGASRRMGRDKAQLRVGGVRLVERAAAALDAVFDEVVIVAAPGFAAPGREVIHDLRPGEGPLAGIETALERAAGGGVFVLACDLPHVGAEAIAFVAAAANPATAAVEVCYAALGEERQPLCGVWSAGSRPAVAGALDAGRRGVVELVERLPSRAVELTDELPFFRPDLLANLNRPEDLRAVAGGPSAARRVPA